MKFPFKSNPYLTGIALAYKNPDIALIADEVLPRVPVGGRTFEYNSFPVADAFTVPDTTVGRTSAPNRVEFGATRLSDFVEDRGLDDPIPYSDIEEAQRNGGGYDPLAHATSYTTNLILLDREVRVSNLVFNADSYVTDHKTVCSGTKQWSHADSDPAEAILEAIEDGLFAYNTMVLGPQVWQKLRVNPNMIKKVLGSANTSGILTRQQVADALEIPRILVGAARVNTARKGQAAVLDRAWGKHAALLFIDSTADTNRGITFGFTAELGNRISGEEFQDRDIGLQGGVIVRTGERVKELVIAKDCGYFFQNAIA